MLYYLRFQPIWLIPFLFCLAVYFCDTRWTLSWGCNAKVFKIKTYAVPYFSSVFIASVRSVKKHNSLCYFRSVLWMNIRKVKPLPNPPSCYNGEYKTWTSSTLPSQILSLLAACSHTSGFPGKGYLHPHLYFICLRKNGLISAFWPRTEPLFSYNSSLRVVCPFYLVLNMYWIL